MQVPGFRNSSFLGQVRNFEDVDLSLGCRDLVGELIPTFGERFVFRAESGFVDHPGLVEVVELVDLLADLDLLPFEESEKLGFFLDGPVRPFEFGRDFTV